MTISSTTHFSSQQTTGAE